MFMNLQNTVDTPYMTSTCKTPIEIALGVDEN